MAIDVKIKKKEIRKKKKKNHGEKKVDGGCCKVTEYCYSLVLERIRG